MGVKRVKMCPFLEKVNIFSWKIVDIHQEPFGSQMGIYFGKKYIMNRIGIFKGSKWGSKGKKCALF